MEACKNKDIEKVKTILDHTPRNIDLNYFDNIFVCLILLEITLFVIIIYFHLEYRIDVCL